MFTIKRLFLILVIAVVAYLFWPRTPSMAGYNPSEMAALQLQFAKQSAGKQWFAHGVTAYRLFEGQYHFPPIAALKCAIDFTRAASLFRTSADDGDKQAAEKPLALVYAEIRSQTGRTFDANAAASQQVQGWLLAENGSVDEAARVMSSQLALVYGGVAAEYLPAARDLAAARAAAKNSDWTAAAQDLKEGWAAAKTAGDK